jgi:hypothetical protein
MFVSEQVLTGLSVQSTETTVFCRVYYRTFVFGGICMPSKVQHWYKYTFP